MEKYFNICNKNIKLYLPAETDIGTDFGIFEIPPTNADLFFDCKITDKLPETHGSFFGKSWDSEIFSGSDFIQRRIKIYDDGSLCNYSLNKANYSLTYFTPKGFEMLSNERYFLTAIGFNHLLLLQETLILHSSYIQYNNKAVLFCAPSGTGKSTQAGLWHQYKNAEIVNGDKSGINIIGNSVYAHSVPFSGTSGININKSLPLSAIVLLEKAPEENITELKGLNALLGILKNTYLDLLVAREKELAFDLISDVISKVKIYRFGCTKNETAVNCLFDKLEAEGLL